MVKRRSLSSHRVARKTGEFKSKLESRVAEALTDALYEKVRLKYIVPVERHTYTPDFTFDGNDTIVIEVKGRLTATDRKKMLLIKEQYPEKDFYLIFGNAREKLYKGSKTTYADWAEKNGFYHCDFYRSGIPQEWINKFEKGTE